MNERIQELYRQAFVPHTTTCPDNNMPYETVLFSTEKFAELLVRECLKIADGQKKYVEDMEVFNEQDATWNKARIQQSQQIVDKMKKHFGVEE